jgi:hypothetical protein
LLHLVVKVVSAPSCFHPKSSSAKVTVKNNGLVPAGGSDCQVKTPGAQVQKTGETRVTGAVPHGQRLRGSREKQGENMGTER